MGMYSQKEEFYVKNTSPVNKGKVDIPKILSIIIIIINYCYLLWFNKIWPVIRYATVIAVSKN